MIGWLLAGHSLSAQLTSHRVVVVWKVGGRSITSFSFLYRKWDKNPMILVNS